MKNPLIDYYREKDIYVKLPTQAKWYKNKPHLTKDGEIGVLPMTLKDEMLFKIPDSLYNGESLYEVLRSIVPDIADPYEISIPDVDVILLASRAVSSKEGSELPIDTRCPVCKQHTSYSINIPALLSKVKVVNEGLDIEIKKLKLKLRPNTLASVTASSIQVVESTRLLASVNREDINDANKQLMQKSLETSTAATIALLADNVESIELPDGTVVTDLANIIEWIANSDASTINTLKKHTVKLNDNGLPTEFPFICDNEECKHEFRSKVQFNPTFFFTAK
jgi:hypothetical protein